jgi:hypothetical protein
VVQVSTLISNAERGFIQVLLQLDCHTSTTEKILEGNPSRLSPEGSFQISKISTVTAKKKMAWV